jgi:hypothetical protein
MSCQNTCLNSNKCKNKTCRGSFYCGRHKKMPKSIWIDQYYYDCYYFYTGVEAWSNEYFVQNLEKAEAKAWSWIIDQDLYRTDIVKLKRWLETIEDVNVKHSMGLNLIQSKTLEECEKREVWLAEQKKKIIPFTGIISSWKLPVIRKSMTEPTIGKFSIREKTNMTSTEQSDLPIESLSTIQDMVPSNKRKQDSYIDLTCDEQLYEHKKAKIN